MDHRITFYLSYGTTKLSFIFLDRRMRKLSDYRMMDQNSNYWIVGYRIYKKNY